MQANDISILVAWSSVAAVLARMAMVWQRMPARAAIHFNLRGQADGWSSRQDFLVLSVLLMAGPATASTLARMISPQWPEVWVLAAVAVIVAAAIWRAIEFNLEAGQRPFLMRWLMLPVSMALVFAFLNQLGR